MQEKLFCKQNIALQNKSTKAHFTDKKIDLNAQMRYNLEFYF